MRFTQVYPVLLACTIILLLCNSFQMIIMAQTENLKKSETNLPRQLKIAILTDALFSDAGWGAFAYNAGQGIISKHGYQINFLDNVSIPNIESTLRNYAKGDYDLIISQGYEWGNPTLKVAKDFPNTKFLVFTGIVNASNVASIFPKQQEVTYLLGALAAMMSKTHVIGFVGGDEKYPNLNNIYEGYKQGALDIDPGMRVLVTYLGDWDSPSKGKEAAISQINAGADFLLHVADTSGQGVIQAAKERGKYAFGAVSDQNKLAPDTVVTSFILDADKAYEQVIPRIQNDNFTGEIYAPGLEQKKNSTGEGILYLAPFHSFDNRIPPDVKIKLSQLAEDIINKKIVVREIYNVS
jgi:basic membrane protein A and related proteins